MRPFHGFVEHGNELILFKGTRVIYEGTSGQRHVSVDREQIISTLSFCWNMGKCPF